MMGHSIAFASFHIVEVMSNPVFASKRIGYLAAAQSFSPTTDVLLLTTNQFKKDLTNGKLQDCSQALTCLGKLITEELGRDLEHDVSLLLNSPRGYIRKKTLLVLFRLIMVHPDTLPVVSARFRERLKDSDPGVVCAAVTVTCELARSSPSSFLALAPTLYELLMNRESNNWMLIKIVKLMGVLTPLEPRLGKKLVEPLTHLMRTTRAKSLLYECCSTVTSGMMAHPEAVELCAQQLAEFMDDSDQNLKYLGLLSMRKLIQAHPAVAVEHRDNILDCLDDEDIGIRMRALELVAEFVTKRTLRDISRILLRKLRRASSEGFAENVSSTPTDGEPMTGNVVDQESPYRESLARELLRAGHYYRSSDPSKAGYQMLVTADDFAWYTTTILTGLAELPLLSERMQDLVGEQLLELTSRVEALRPISVQVSLALLSPRKVVKKNQSVPETTAESEIQQSETTEDENTEEQTVSEKVESPPATETLHEETVPTNLSTSLAGSTAWILGEYCDLLENPVGALQALTSFSQKSLNSAAQVRILTACVKILTSTKKSHILPAKDLVETCIESLIQSEYAEVQERACFFKSMIKSTVGDSYNELALLFDGKLVPVDHRAQAKVPRANDLDLDTPLVDTGNESLYTYLVQNLGDHQEEEYGEEDGDLFQEAVFASSTLSMSGIQSTSHESYSNTSAYIGNLPQVDNKERSAFYLGSSSTDPNHKTNGNDSTDHNEEERTHSVKYVPSKLSKEVVVITEQNPLGLALSDDEGSATNSKTTVNPRLQAAFDGAFGNVAVSETKSGKKKKKRKDGQKKSKKSKEKQVSQPSTGKAIPNLIDFDGEVGINDTRNTAKQDQNTDNPQKPQNTVDDLLM